MSCKEVVGVSNIEFCSPEQEKEFMNCIDMIAKSYNESVDVLNRIMENFANSIVKDTENIKKLAASIDSLPTFSFAKDLKFIPGNPSVNPNDRKYTGKRKW